MLQLSYVKDYRIVQNVNLPFKFKLIEISKKRDQEPPETFSYKDIFIVET
jgi:hypothetical protein